MIITTDKMEKCWDDPTSYLSQFDPRRRSFIANLFCYAVRGKDFVHEAVGDPTTDVEVVLARVKVECENRIDTPHTSDAMRADCNQLRDALHAGVTKEFAQFIIQREQWKASVSFEQVQAAKTAHSRVYANKAMASKAASDKQKAYLKMLGYTGERDGLSMSEASILISRLKE